MLNAFRLFLIFEQTRGCKFVKFQEIKIQELPNQVPIGHIPRSLTVVTRGELTRSVTAGDVVSLSGIFVPTPFTGFRAMRAGLITGEYFKRRRAVHRVYEKHCS